ncbi:MAG: DUF3667 domain-containing protein [Ferruginibacter sp.]
MSAEFEYCPQCGQKANLHRFSLHEIFHEFLHAFTHADKGLFFLVKELALHPGRVAAEYVEGKRKKYYNPFSFLLICAAIFVFSNKIFHSFERNPQLQKLAQIQQALKNNASGFTPAQVKNLKMASRAMEAQHFVSANTNILQLIATPLIAFIAWLFFRYKKQRNYAEILVADCFFAGFSALFFVVIISPLMALAGNNNILYFSFLIAGLIFQVTYFGVAYHTFFGFNSKLAYGRTILASLVAVIVWTLLSSMLMLLYIKGFFL